MKNVLVCCLFVLSGCADHVSLSDAEYMTKVGFWYGFWHGAILLYSWLISLFDNDVSIFATYNNGGWYYFGFVTGIASTVRTGEAFLSVVTVLIMEITSMVRRVAKN